MTGRDEPVVTTTMFSEAERAAWAVAAGRGMAIEAADLRALLAPLSAGPGPRARADLRTRLAQVTAERGELAGRVTLTPAEHVTWLTAQAQIGRGQNPNLAVTGALARIVARMAGMQPGSDARGTALTEPDAGEQDRAGVSGCPEAPRAVQDGSGPQDANSAAPEAGKSS
jgi:hypothetical protein